ncbi:MAG TPA: protein kinase [Rudaea sp.]|nr:protein kinase [Rudaea sp.]
MQTSPSLRDLFEAAIELAPEARAAFLDEHCADAGLRALVERLLVADVDAAELFCGGARAAAAAIGDAELADALPPGSRIGPFELIAVLGEGGSSTVFRARRELQGVRQDLALKVLRRGLYSPDAQRQFRRERQALAQLQHPGIARLIEGGVTDNGLAYIALELVEGKPITDYARERRLDLRQRLALFLQICRAVEAAHRALIVHRDLKPSNVLVADDGQIKLLDFGIAKLLASDDDTQTRLPAFTPAYAAPEQRDGGLVTTATDVYALGILLGELVTGQRLSGQTGRTPSSQITGGEAPGALPAPAPITRRALRGDIDNIVLKAIAVEPERRYASAGALADDVERMLDGRPVAAHPPSRVYRARKFIQRHRGGVAATVLFLLALFSAFGIALWQAKVARDAARTAGREAARANATKDFLLRVFRASDPRIAQDKPRGEITAKELLDLNAPRIDKDFASDPDTQIELLGETASIYRAFDDQERYQTLHRQQYELARKHYGDLHPIVVADLIDDAGDASNRDEFKLALQLLDRIDPLLHRAGLDDSTLRARWWLVRSDALSSEFATQAERDTALHNAVDLYAKVAPESNGYVDALNALGSEQSGQMNDVEAAKSFALAIQIAERLPDRDDAGLQPLYGNLASALLYQGDFDGAEKAYAKVVDLARQTTGEHHHRYWVPAANHAAAVHQRGDRERAQKMFADLLPLLPDQPQPQQAYDAAFVREMYARCLVNEGRAQLAVPLLEAIREQYTQGQLYEFDLRRVNLILGDAYDQAGRADDARRTLEALLDEWVAKGAPDFYPLLSTRERWGRFLLTHGDLDGAEQQFNEVIAQAHGRKLTPIALAHGGLARVALAQGDVPAANAASAAALEMFEHVDGFRNVRTGPYLWLIRADALRRSGDAKGAREWAQRALDASRRYDDPSAASIREAEAAVQATTKT